MLALTIPAFADDPSYSIAVTNNSTTTGVSISGNTFTAYKLFSVSYSGSNPSDPHSYTYDSSCLDVTYTPTLGGTAYSHDSLVSWLGDSNTKPQDIRDFADYVYNTYIKGQTIATSVETSSAAASGESATIHLNSAGYYLVYGTGSDGNTTVTASVSLTTADPTATVTPKLSVPTLTKQIQHNELATATDNGWGNVGDNQIGDTVHYRTITSVPDTNNYTSYTYVIHDTMTSGLTFNPSSVVVKIGENGKVLEAGTDYTVDTAAAAALGETFTVTFNDIKTTISSNNLSTADHFYVTYDATLNKDAILYPGHNDNTAYLQYSNNPYDGDSKGSTPPKTVYDWTFTMGVNKTDKAGNGLTGAEFILNTNKDSTDSAIALIKNTEGTSYTIAPAGTADTVTTISAGSITIKGLDDSTIYYLHETKAPDGYNLLTGPVEIQISADYETAGNAVKNGYPTVKVDGTESGTLSTNVKNYTGNELPSTGGMGTTAFYVVGGTLAAGAGIMLIARKRVKNEK